MNNCVNIINGICIGEYPDFLKKSLIEFSECNDKSLKTDIFCEVQSSINICEVENLISSKEANLLREKILGIEVNND